MPDLNAPYFERVLLIHMAALMAIEGIDADGQDGILDRVLAREIGFWEELLLARQLDPALQDGLLRAMAAITLIKGAPDRTQALDILRSLSFFANEREPLLEAVAQVLHDAYGGRLWIRSATTGFARRASGEQSISRVWKGHFPEGTRYMSDASTIDREELLRRRRSAFETLVQRAQIAPEDADLIRQLLTADNLDGLWEAALEAATIASQSSGDVYRAIDLALAESLRERPNLNVVVDLYNRLPRDTVALQETAIEAARQTVAVTEERGLDKQHPDQYLVLLNNYVGRLLQGGRWTDAGTEAEKAVVIARTGYKDEPQRFAGELAQALENAVTLATSSGRSAEAVAPMEEALAIYRELAADGSFNSKRALAICLNNRIHLFDNLGSFEKAVESGEEAVKLFRDLVPANVAEFHPTSLADWVSNVHSDLATCLLALSTALNKVKRYRESLATVEEAVQAFIPLADDYPDYFRPLLGQAYNNWAMGLDGLGRPAEAAAKVLKAVAIFRDLDGIRPDVYRPYLAHVLVGESLALAKSDRLPDAADVAREALELYEGLAQSRPDAFRPNVLQACDNLVMILRGLGREEEAVQIHTRIQRSYRPTS